MSWSELLAQYEKGSESGLLLTKHHLLKPGFYLLLFLNEAGQNKEKASSFQLISFEQ